jgi:hypothetical protein
MATTPAGMEKRLVDKTIVNKAAFTYRIAPFT